MDTMSIYAAARSVPPTAVKRIQGGAYASAGLSDVNPQWRIEKMTEIFGPVGIGWKWAPVEVWEAHNCIYAHVVVNICDAATGKWSEDVHGYGGTKVGSKDDSDVYKSTMTDAISNALRYFGVGADVWFNAANKTNQFDTKYSAPAKRAEGPQSARAQTPNNVPRNGANAAEQAHAKPRATEKQIAVIKAYADAVTLQKAVENFGPGFEKMTTGQASKLIERINNERKEK